MAGREELGILEAVDVIDVLVEDTQRQDGQWRVEKVVYRYEHRVKNSLSKRKRCPINQYIKVEHY
jgi:hypothetical protein